MGREEGGGVCGWSCQVAMKVGRMSTVVSASNQYVERTSEFGDRRSWANSLGQDSQIEVKSHGLYILTASVGPIEGCSGSGGLCYPRRARYHYGRHGLTHSMILPGQRPSTS